MVDVGPTLYKDPNFAAICSFFNKFGVILGLKPFPFTKLEALFQFGPDGESEYFILMQLGRD